MGIDARLYAVTPEGKHFTEAEVWKMGYELGTIFGAENFMRTEEDPPHGYWKKHHNISIEKTIEEDSDEIPTRKYEDRQILKVHLWTRYYGIGYERGDLLLILGVAAWLEAKIPGCEVRYGGDSSGVVSGVFDEKERAKLLAHFVSSHGRDYFQAFGSLGGGIKPPICDFCKMPMTQFMFGGGGTVGGFSCHGCEKRLRTDDGGKTFRKWDDLNLNSRPVAEVVHMIQQYIGKYKSEEIYDLASLANRLAKYIKENEQEFRKDVSLT